MNAKRKSKSNFLFGESALNRISGLDRALRFATVSEISREGGRYSPWLCQETPFSLVVFSKFLKDRRALELISTKYSTDQNGSNLSIFGLEETGFKIWTSIEEDPDSADIYESAFSRIRKSDALNSLFNSVVESVLPIRSDRSNVRKQGIGFSSVLARNSIFLSCPTLSEFADLELAVNMAHELGHQVLHVYQSCDALFESDSFAPVYSGIRRMDRPAILSLHAAVALGFMITAFESFTLWGNAGKSELSYGLARLSELRSDLLHTLISLRKTEMTSLGREMTLELALCCG